MCSLRTENARLPFGGHAHGMFNLLLHTRLEIISRCGMTVSLVVISARGTHNYCSHLPKEKEGRSADYSRVKFLSFSLSFCTPLGHRVEGVCPIDERAGVRSVYVAVGIVRGAHVIFSYLSLLLISVVDACDLTRCCFICAHSVQVGCMKFAWVFERVTRIATRWKEGACCEYWYR